MNAPVTRPFVTDPVLTQMAVNFKNPDIAYIADEVMPRLDVGGEKYDYDYFPPEELFTVPDTRVGRRGRPNQVEFNSEKRQAAVVDHGLDDPIPVSDINEAARQRQAGNTRYDPEARAVEGLTHLVKLDREVRVAGLVMDASNYDADKQVTLTGADKWSDDTSDPIEDVIAAMDATFIARPNIAVCSRDVYSRLRVHPRIVSMVLGNDGTSGIVTAQQIAERMELQAIFVGDTYANMARKGQPANVQRLWGNGFALLHRNRMASTDNGLPTWGFTAQLPVNGEVMMAGRIVDANGGGLEGSVTVRVGEKVQEHIVAPAVGYLINAPI